MMHAELQLISMSVPCTWFKDLGGYLIAHLSTQVHVGPGHPDRYLNLKKGNLRPENTISNNSVFQWFARQFLEALGIYFVLGEL